MKKLGFLFIFLALFFCGCNDAENDNTPAIPATEDTKPAEPETKNPGTDDPAGEGPVTDDPVVDPVVPHEHDYTINMVPSTCDEDGYYTGTCECGDTYSIVIPAGHYKKWVEISKAGAGVEGLKIYECTKCHTEYDREVIPALHYLLEVAFETQWDDYCSSHTEFVHYRNTWDWVWYVTGASAKARITKCILTKSDGTILFSTEMSREDIIAGNGFHTKKEGKYICPRLPYDEYDGALIPALESLWDGSYSIDRVRSLTYDAIKKAETEYRNNIAKAIPEIDEYGIKSDDIEIRQIDSYWTKAYEIIWIQKGNHTGDPVNDPKDPIVCNLITDEQRPF